LEETTIVELIHETQLYFTGAKISLAASFGSEGVLIVVDHGAMGKGILKVETVNKLSKAMRILMAEFLKKEKTWGPEKIKHNWNLFPKDLAEKAVDRYLGEKVPGAM